jgi:hypothetical protein
LTHAGATETATDARDTVAIVVAIKRRIRARTSPFWRGICGTIRTGVSRILIPCNDAEIFLIVSIKETFVKQSLYYCRHCDECDYEVYCSKRHGNEIADALKAIEKY